jgi:hypothetical protein
MDATNMSEMHEIALSSQNNLEGTGQMQNLSSVGGIPN